MCATRNKNTSERASTLSTSHREQTLKTRRRRRFPSARVEKQTECTRCRD